MRLYNMPSITSLHMHSGWVDQDKVRILSVGLPFSLQGCFKSRKYCAPTILEPTVIYLRLMSLHLCTCYFLHLESFPFFINLTDCTWNAFLFFFIWLIPVHPIKLSLVTTLSWHCPYMQCCWFTAPYSPCTNFWPSLYRLIVKTSPNLHHFLYPHTLPCNFAALWEGCIYFPDTLSMVWSCDFLWPGKIVLRDVCPVLAWTPKNLVSGVLELYVSQENRLGCPTRGWGSTWRAAELTPKKQSPWPTHQLIIDTWGSPENCEVWDLQKCLVNLGAHDKPNAVIV